MITIFIVSKAAPVQPEEYFPYWIQVEIEMRPFRCSYFACQAHDKLLVLLMDSRLKILVFSSTLFKSSRRNISNHSPLPQKNPQTKPQQQKTKQTKPPKLTTKPKTKQNNRKRIFTLLFSSRKKFVLQNIRFWVCSLHLCLFTYNSVKLTWCGFLFFWSIRHKMRKKDSYRLFI